MTEDEKIRQLKQEIEELSLKYNKSLEEDENAYGDEKIASLLVAKQNELKKVLNNKYKVKTVENTASEERKIIKRGFKSLFFPRKLKKYSINKNTLKKSKLDLLKKKRNLLKRELELEDEDIDEIRINNALGFIDAIEISFITIILCIACIVLYNILV